MVGVEPITIQKWARNERLHPVSGPHIDGCHQYLFRRDEIQKWADSEYITASEMAKRLGISYTQLLVWVWQGKIKPVSGPGIDDCKHYLFSTKHHQ